MRGRGGVQEGPDARIHSASTNKTSTSTPGSGCQTRRAPSSTLCPHTESHTFYATGIRLEGHAEQEIERQRVVHCPWAFQKPEVAISPQEGTQPGSGACLCPRVPPPPLGKAHNLQRAPLRKAPRPGSLSLVPPAQPPGWEGRAATRPGGDCPPGFHESCRPLYTLCGFGGPGGPAAAWMSCLPHSLAANT